jgi:hypothetical protein
LSLGILIVLSINSRFYPLYNIKFLSAHNCKHITILDLFIGLVINNIHAFVENMHILWLQKRCPVDIALRLFKHIAIIEDYII